MRKVINNQLIIDEKPVGYFCFGKFVKPVKGSRHMLRKPPAWAIDAWAFDHVIKKKADFIIVKDSETGINYTVEVALFDEKKGKMNRGFDEQYFLPLSYWKKEVSN